MTEPNSVKKTSSTMILDGCAMTPDVFCKNINKYYSSVGGELMEKDDEMITSQLPSTPLDNLSIGEIKHHLRLLNTSKATSTEELFL